MNAQLFQKRCTKAVFCFCCLVVAAVILGLGIASPTGLTGKDEYLLGLRIPLEMMQDGHWWIPFVDGEPRLKKPPMLYWLGRASFEVFGPSLLAARAITVAFTLLLLGCTAWLGRYLTGRWKTGLLAAAVLLGMSGMASESRRLMLDVPVAALSTAALCCYLSWLDRPRMTTLLGIAACLGAALMTKGPFAFVACGGGMLALWAVRQETLSVLRQRWGAHLLMLGLTFALPLFWYLHVDHLYGKELALVAQGELEARQIGLSFAVIGGIVTLSLPWSFVAFQGLWSLRHEPRVRFAATWLLATLVPFFFIRSFERYLIGSLPALALLAAFALETDRAAAWGRRLGSLSVALPVALLAALLWRWQLGSWWLLALFVVFFVFVWWRPVSGGRQFASSPFGLAIAAALLWSVGWGIAFPALGVNKVPEDVTALAHGKPVILFGDMQPALLPMLEKRPLRRRLDPPTAPGTLITIRAENRAALDKRLADLNLKTVLRLEYQALISAGSGIRFAKAGAKRDDWKQAWNERSPNPLMSTVQVFEVLP
ncbi:MAG: glycosyltransferase family 39 protein [Betaproteobacteria bacterium]|nr:glycosyltransferase family 39 protein [Betaproteobacteria bacterium]